MSDVVNALNQQSRSSGVLDAIAHPTVVNPLAAMSNALSVAGKVYDLRQAQAGEALGQAYQQAVDPNTGVVDYNRFRSIAAQDPRAAMAMQSGLVNAAQIDTNSYNLHMARLGHLSSTMGQLLSDYPHGVPQDAVNGAVDRAVQTGVITQAEADQVRPQFSNNPIQNSQILVQGLARNLNGQQALDAARPGTGTIETGQGTVGVTTTPRLSVLGQQGALTTSGDRINTGLPSVSQMLTQVGQKAYGDVAKRLGVPEGTEITIPMVQRWVDQGAGGLVFQGVPGGQGSTSTGVSTSGGVGTSSAPPIPPPAGTTLRGGYQPRPGSGGGGNAAPASGGVPGGQPTPAPNGGNGGIQPPAQPQSSSTQPPATAQPQGTTPQSSAGFTPVVTNIPGVEEANRASAAQYSADNTNAGSYQQRIWPLVNAAHIIDTQGTTTGRGAEAARSVIGHLQTLASIFTPADLQTIGQAKFEELNKYLTQAVNAQPFAQGSDARLASALTGNPSAHISTMANKDILKAMIGLERMKQMAITDFNNQNGQPAQYSSFQRNWQNTHDPRAFIFDMLSEDQRKKMVYAMKPNELDAFQRTLKLVRDNPGIMNTAAMP